MLRRPNSLSPSPLLLTKLSPPPVRAGLVARPQLMARLEAHASTTLTVLAAPAGFGKTTLLAAWLATRPSRPAWLTLEAEDSEPIRFWWQVLAALQQTMPELPADLSEPLQRLPPALDEFVTLLANALAPQAMPIVLVLDDYHTISDLEVHRSLAALIAHAPPCFQLVMAGRSDPPLPLARLHARGQLHELRADDLSFTPREAAEFLSQTMGLDLRPEAAATLIASTAGWPAGLQLAALWLRDHPANGDDQLATLAASERHLLTFLADEVIAHQPPEVQRFLLDTAILEHLCPELCDYLTAEARRANPDAPPLITRSSETLIAELVQHNLFVSRLDAHGAWHAYHTLFRDALRRELVRQRGPAAQQRLHRRAAAWFAAASTVDTPLFDEALRHALAGQAYELAADLLGPRCDQLGAEGRIGPLLTWLGALPEAVLLARPALALRYAWLLFLNGNQDAAANWLARGEAALANAPDPDQMSQALPAAVRAVMATTWYDDEAILRYVAEAQALIPADELIWTATLAIAGGLAQLVRGEARAAAVALQRAADLAIRADCSYQLMASTWHLGRARLALGRLDEAARVFQRLGNEGTCRFRGYRDVGLAAVAYERADPTTAHELALRGLQALERTAGQPRVIIFAQLLLAQLAHDAADPEAMLWLERAELLARQLGLHEDLAAILALRATLALAIGDRATAEEWALGLDFDPSQADVRREVELIPLAQLRLTQQRPSEALALAEALATAAEAEGRIPALVKLLVIRAEAYAALGQTSQRQAVQRKAARLAHEAGLTRLHGTLQLAVPPPTLGTSFQVTLAPPKGVAAVGTPGTSNGLLMTEQGFLCEPLSERELRVLGLVAAGCSNQEIASTLIVSINTVKTHLKRIYEKLQVNSRVAAVERARALGLYR
ncbi:MAG: LuxR C-terminal-related transcriptional regulator [Oscillochloridaceae bacterium umkhey_bin13]